MSMSLESRRFEPSEGLKKEEYERLFRLVDFPPMTLSYLDTFYPYFSGNEDDVSEEEIEQVKTSGREIAEGKARRFKNVEEYLKTLDEESE